MRDELITAGVLLRGRFRLQRRIGQGTFGEAWLATDTSADSPANGVVVKAIATRNVPEREKVNAEKEAMLLGSIQHPFVVRGICSWSTQSYLFIAMEYCAGGDLAARIKRASSSGRLLRESQILTWFAQLVCALNHLHSRKILHRDLKAANVFLTQGHCAKLGDLGIARVLEATAQMAQTVVGTPYYMSPEALANRPYGTKSDVWSLGCILYEMCTLRHAFEARNLNALVLKILRGTYPPIPDCYSPGMRQLVASLLVLDPQQRPSTSDILRDPLIRDAVSAMAARGEGWAPAPAPAPVPPLSLPLSLPPPPSAPPSARSGSPSIERRRRMRRVSAKEPTAAELFREATKPSSSPSPSPSPVPPISAPSSASAPAPAPAPAAAPAPAPAALPPLLVPPPPPASAPSLAPAPALACDDAEELAGALSALRQSLIMQPEEPREDSTPPSPAPAPAPVPAPAPAAAPAPPLLLPLPLPPRACPPASAAPWQGQSPLVSAACAQLPVPGDVLLSLCAAVALAAEGEDAAVVAAGVGLGQVAPDLLIPVPPEVAEEGETAAERWLVGAQVVRAVLLARGGATQGKEGDHDMLLEILKRVDALRFAQHIAS